MTLPDRFWAKVQKTETCWLWTAALDMGYGVINVDRKKAYAHRLAYEMLVGPIPAGLQLDHVKERCGNRHCVNPAHLEPVTSAENKRRGQAGIREREKTQCPSGHPYDEANTLHNKRGHRRCRICCGVQSHSYYAKRKAATA